MALAWDRLAEWIDCDEAASAVDRAVNDRGIAFDSALAERLLDEDARITGIILDEVAATLGAEPDVVRAQASSPAQFSAATGAPNAQAATVETLDHPLARARQALASIARGKLQAGLRRVHPDGRLRDTLLYYGAHTGRWSGRGMQLHNMSRPAAWIESQIEDGTLDWDCLAREVLEGRHCNADERDALVRATLTASPGHRLVACDYSAIEDRGTAWAAGDQGALDVYRDDKSPYKMAATQIYNVPYDEVTKAQRQVGKIACLACGYQGGVKAFESFARLYRLDLSGMNVRGVIDAWRAAHPLIVSLWHTCERAFRRALAHPGRVRAGPWTYQRSDDGKAVACLLPSGRPIVYHDVEIEGRQIKSLGPRGQAYLYGGLLVENAVQGLCRDLLADAIVKAEQAGMRPVLSVHDEIVCEIPDATHADLDRLRAIMLDTPAWATGLPIDAAGWVGERYRK
jgi:DNA polymerase